MQSEPAHMINSNNTTNNSNNNSTAVEAATTATIMSEEIYNRGMLCSSYMYLSPKLGHIVLVLSEPGVEELQSPLASPVHSLIAVERVTVLVDGVVGQMHEVFALMHEKHHGTTVSEPMWATFSVRLNCVTAYYDSDYCC